MIRFVTKNIQNNRPINLGLNNRSVTKEQKEEEIPMMNIDDKIKAANDLLSDEMPKKPVKRLKKDKSIIERTESSTIILTEDNKQLLND